jgi:hypothetical protein
MLTQQHGNEDQLLICCTRVSQDHEIQNRITQLLARRLDWQTVLNRSWWHRVRPLTYFHLKSQPEGLVPTEVLDELSRHATELAARNLRLSHALDEVASVFEQHKLRMLAFKGPTLTMDAYGDLSLRECGDLDMLVHHDDFPRVKNMLTAHGFTSSWDRVVENREAFACEFLSDEAELDVHWDLAPGWFNYRVDFDQLWERGQCLSDGAHFARKMRPEDAMVVLCIHGTKHWWERLRWACDIAEIVNRGLVKDWDQVHLEAAKANARRAVDLGLQLAGELLSADLPAEIRPDLGRSPVAGRLAAQVGAWLEHAEHGPERRTLRERLLFRLRLCERARDRLPQLVHYLLAVPPRLTIRPR